MNDFQFFRKELLLEIDEYTQPAHRDELVALAQTIQNLIIIEKGTYPNDPNFGVGIGRYIFELMDEQTVSEIRTEIERQVNKYIFHDKVAVAISLTPVKLPIQNSNTLKISVSIYPNERAFVTMDPEERIVLDLAFSGNSKNNKIVSRLIN